MRKSCMSCVRKHVAKAIILLSEAELGYPMHFYLALGNLSEAEDECVCSYPALAKKIRKIRIKIEERKYKGDLLELIKETLLLDLGSE